jgi:DNA-binding transcriptional ArsR family regulator
MTSEPTVGRVLDRDLAPVASLIGDPTRIAMLAALAEGRSLPAGDLARRAGVHPATATAHLRRLVGWFSRATGRSLRVAPDYDRRLDTWLSRSNGSH